MATWASASYMVSPTITTTRRQGEGANKMWTKSLAFPLVGRGARLAAAERD